MPDDVLLKAVRRFWTTEQVTSAYETILTAYQSRLDKVTVITGKATEGDSANAQVVIGREDYRQWMEVLEARLEEIAADEAGTGTTHTGTEHVIHSNRYFST